MNTLAEPTPASAFVTVTVCAPSVALAPTVTGTVIDVALTTVTAPRVMFASPKETVAPDTKPVPVIVTAVCAEPCALALGDVEVTVGPAFTVNPFVSVEFSVSGFVTVTFRAPVVAVAATVMLAVSCVALTKVVELTVIPVPLKVTAAPLTKFVPLTVIFWFVAPCPLLVGLVEVTVGAGAVDRLMPVIEL